jgi:O-antigen/teichoic acid export membrane protein
MYNAKRFIQEKLKNEGIQKYLTNTGWLFSTRIITMVIGFLVVAIVARYLGPTNYGTLSYAFSFVGLFSFLASIGIDNVLYRDLVKYPERENEFLGTAISLKIIASITTVGIIIGTLFFIQEDTISTGLVVITSIAYLFQSLNLINYSFQARVQAKFPAIISVVVVIILSLMKIAVVYYGKGLYYFAAIYALEPLLYGAFFLAIYKSYYGDPLKWSFNKVIAISMLRESFPLMLSSVFIIIYSRIDQIMIKHMIDVTSVGLYDAAVRLSEVWYFLPGIIVSSVYPSIVNAHTTNHKIYAKRLIYLTVLLVGISCGVGLIVTLFAQQIMLIVFGQQFITGYHVLQFYVWSGVGISIGTVLSQYLITEKLASKLLYISIIGMVLNVVLNIILIPRYGISGSAFATLFSYIIGPLSIILFTEPRLRIMKLIKVMK